MMTYNNYRHLLYILAAAILLNAITIGTVAYTLLPHTTYHYVALHGQHKPMVWAQTHHKLGCTR